MHSPGFSANVPSAPESQQGHSDHSDGYRNGLLNAGADGEEQEGAESCPGANSSEPLVIVALGADREPEYEKKGSADHSSEHEAFVFADPVVVDANSKDK